MDPALAKGYKDIQQIIRSVKSDILRSSAYELWNQVPGYDENSRPMSGLNSQAPGCRLKVNDILYPRLTEFYDKAFHPSRVSPEQLYDELKTCLKDGGYWGVIPNFPLPVIHPTGAPARGTRVSTSDGSQLHPSSSRLPINQIVAKEVSPFAEPRRSTTPHKFSKLHDRSSHLSEHDDEPPAKRTRLTRNVAAKDELESESSQVMHTEEIEPSNALGLCHLAMGLTRTLRGRSSPIKEVNPSSGAASNVQYQSSSTPAFPNRIMCHEKKTKCSVVEEAAAKKMPSRSALRTGSSAGTGPHNKPARSSSQKSSHLPVAESKEYLELQSRIKQLEHQLETHAQQSDEAIKNLTLQLLRRTTESKRLKAYVDEKFNKLDDNPLMYFSVPSEDSAPETQVSRMLSPGIPSLVQEPVGSSYQALDEVDAGHNFMNQTSPYYFGLKEPEFTFLDLKYANEHSAP